MNEPREILVMLPSWVGDVVMATPALRAIRARYPDATITYLQRPYLGDLLAGCEAWFDRVVHWPEDARGKSNGIAANLGLVKQLRARRPDLAILFQNSFRSAAIARLSGARRRVGFSRDGRGWLLTDRIRPVRENGRFVPVPMIDSYKRIAETAGAVVHDDRLELGTTPEQEAEAARRLGAGDARPLLVLNPGASFGESKRWPGAYYAALADHFERRGMRVVASCAPAERHVAEELRAAATRPIEIFSDPPLGLGPLKAVIRRAALLVTNDTGPRHFAAAFGVPVVTIYGSTDPAWTVTPHPLEQGVSLALDCQPCQQPVCPLAHLNCLKQLSVGQVIEAAENLLTGIRARSSRVI